MARAVDDPDVSQQILANAAAALKERNGSQAVDASDQIRSDSSPTL